MSLSWTPFLNDFFHACCWLCSFLVILLHMFLPCCWEMLFSPAVGPLFCHSSRRSGSQASLPCRRQSSFIDRSSGFLSLSPASSNLAMFAQTVGFSWSCVRSTASLRLRTLFHVLRDQSTRTTHSVSRARLLWVVTPFQATTTLLVSHEETVSFFSALSAPLCGSLQRRTRGLHVWHLRHHCVVVGSR